jgi:ketosteroid isomerase-like protein
MSQENVEVVRAIYDAYDRGDYRAALDHFHRDVEWFGPPDVSNSGFARGHEGVNHALGTWVGTWDEYHFELRELIDAGDDVLAVGWHRGRGKGSGVEVSEEIFSVWTLHLGEVVRQRMFRDGGQAREAAGLFRTARRP